MDYEDVRRFVTACHTTPKMSDHVNHPSHYVKEEGAVECIDAIQSSMTLEAFRGYLKGNITKYLWRYENKNCEVTDLRKAKWYLEYLLQSFLEKSTSTAKSPSKPQVGLCNDSENPS